MEERKRHEIRNARYKLSREWNEINTSISAVTAAGVNKGLIEPEFAAKLACFELLDPKNRICALPFPLCFAAHKEGPTAPCPDRPPHHHRFFFDAAGLSLVIKQSRPSFSLILFRTCDLFSLHFSILPSICGSYFIRI